MVSPLRHRVAVVTGASAGIGEAVARELARLGASVVVNARREERLQALAAEIGKDNAGDVAVAAGDAGDEDTVRLMLDTAKERFDGEADLVVVNAGRGLNGSLYDSDPAGWEEMFRTNVLGAARLMREAAHRMVADAESGNWKADAHDIVVIGSNVGRHVSPFSSMYGSTKFALHSLAEGLRREIGPRGVRVTLVEPGVVRTEFQEVAGYDPERFGAFMEKIGPVLGPGDVARAVGFVVTQPPAVHVNDLVIRPTRQDYP